MANSTITLRDDRGHAMGEVNMQRGEFVDSDGRRHTSDEETDEQLARYAAHQSIRLTRDAFAAARQRCLTDVGNDNDGRLVRMALMPDDVRYEALSPNYIQGYPLITGIADVICPVVDTPVPSAKFWEWNSDDAFQRPGTIEASPGADVAEISPRLSQKRFDTVERALASAVPTETIQAAAGGIDPLQAAVRRVMTALDLEREIRVAALLTNPASWDPSVVRTLTAATKWNGGTASDPLSDLIAISQASWLPVTMIAMGEQAAFAFSTNPNVQKYIQYHDSSAAVPNTQQLSPLFGLPPIVVVRQKYRQGAAGNAPTYTWGGDVVMVHQPAGGLPNSYDEASTCKTFRWTGGGAPDGVFQGGFIVRTFFLPKRGPKGSTMVVCTHQDGEVMTSKYAGGVIKGAVQ